MEEAQLKLMNESFTWTCKNTWKKSSINTLWCLLGCSIGDLGTILYFQIMEIDFPLMGIMVLAIINGLITSILLETFILSRQMILSEAFNTAIGMSLISMLNFHACNGNVSNDPIATTCNKRRKSR